MFGIYRSGHSCLHNLDPRMKLLLMAGVSLLIYSAKPHGLGVLLILAVLLAYSCKMPLIRFIEWLRPLVVFFTAIFLFHLLLTPGEPLVTGFSFATTDGMYTGVIVVARFILLILFTSILIHTTSPSGLNTAVAYFLSPLGTFGNSIAFMVGVAVTFIPRLFQEKDTIMKGQMARGIKPGGIRGFTAFMVPLFYRSVRKADELSDALESRGYHLKRRYYYYSQNLALRDYIAGGVFSGLAILILFPPV